MPLFRVRKAETKGGKTPISPGIPSGKHGDELEELRARKAELEAELERERAQIFEMKTRLDSLAVERGAKLPSLGESRRASNVSLNGAIESEEEDEEIDFEQALAVPPGKSRPGLGEKQRSLVARKGLNNLQGGVLRRGLMREESNRSTAFIASFLSEHLNKKQEVDGKLKTMMDLGAKPAGTTTVTEQLPPLAPTANGSSKQQPPAELARAPSQVLNGADKDKRRPSSSRALHNRTPSFLKKVLAHKSSRLGAHSMTMLDGFFSLPRGGVYINTSIGPIQFGMPPETVKDSMELGMPVPSIFVVPPERFNLHEGVNVAEIEFPAFFNFFVLRKKVRMVTYPETVVYLRAIMQEALLGPQKKEHLYVDSEYSKFVPPEVYAARANHEKEMAYFAKPRAPDFYDIDIDALIEFIFFDENGKVDLGSGVTILDDGKDGFLVSDSGTDGRKRLGSKNIDDNGSNGPQRLDSDDGEGKDSYETFVSYDLASSCLSVPPSMKMVADTAGQQAFVIPQFGVTVLGNSHGFDPEGSTSGFVVWVNGQGVMVDPPPHSSMLLAKAGIQPKSITAIILTHCHADHEVGTIQKMVTEDKIVLLTTKTIMESFLRKYEAVTGLDREFLQQLVMFRPVYLEEPTYWNGASFRFFYSLHSIPCIGFEATFEGKSIVYSADTYYDMDGLEQMKKEGVLSEARCQALLNFPWDADVVLHEMGVPPIHTPLEALEKLPEKFRKHIYLIHIGAKTARDAKKRGFKIATPGVEHTITLVRSADEENTMLKFFQLISTMDIFRGFSLAQALELWFMAKTNTYEAGTNIVEQGTPGDKFMIILKGSASVTFAGAKKVFRPGDFLGEVSVVTGEVRTATVVADSTVVTFEVDRYAFDYLVMHDARLKIRMTNLIKARSDGSWGAITSNQLLSRFTSSQKTQLQALLTGRILRKGDVVWAKGEPVKIGVLISKGSFRFQEVTAGPSDQGLALIPGMLVFDMIGAMNSYPLTTTLVADAEVCQVFTFEADAMLAYLDGNPLLLLGLLKSVVIL